MGKRNTWAAVCALFLVAVSAGAQGFRNPPEGPASISQAGAFVAQCDDASAVMHNPAGLVQVEGEQVVVGSTLLFPFTSFKSGTLDTEKKFSSGYMPYAFYSTDLGGGNARFGIGLASPFGQSTEWGKNAVRHWNYAVSDYSSMRTAEMSAVMAFRISPELSAGLGLGICRSELDIDSLRVFPPPYPPGEFREKIDVAGTAAAPVGGILYNNGRVSAGLAFRAGYDMKHSGTYSIPGIMLHEKASIEMEFPPCVSAGLAVYPEPGLKIELDAHWYGYSSLDVMKLSVRGLGSVSMARDWKDSRMFSLGMEYRKSSRIKLRAGLGYISSPVPSSTWEPSIPDADSFIVSAGGEFETGFGTLGLGMGVNILKSIERGMPYAGKYESKGYFISFGYRKKI